MALLPSGQTGFRDDLNQRLLAQALAPRPIRNPLEGVAQLAQTYVAANALKGSETRRNDAMQKALAAGTPWIAPDNIYSDRTGEVVVQAGQPAPGTGGLDAMAAALAGSPETAGLGLNLRFQALQDAANQQNERRLIDYKSKLELLNKYGPQAIEGEKSLAGARLAPPTDVREFEYAKNQGYAGTFEDWQKAIKGAAQGGDPSNVREWQFFSTLSPADQERFLTMKRSNPYVNLGDVVARPSMTGTGTTGTITKGVTPDNQPPNAERIAAAKALGTGAGEAAATTQNNAAKASNVIDLLKDVDTLIDKSTGSTLGAGVDYVSGFFGGAPEGAKAVAELKVVQARLMAEQPRMEGPQSNLDVVLYSQAAGQIGDPTVPREIRKAAVKQVRALQEKYRARGAAAATPPPANGGYSIERIAD